MNLTIKQTEMAKSYLKVFLSTVLALFLADGADIFAVDMTDLRAWLAAGIAPVISLIITALDSSDARWGRGSDVPSNQ